MIQSDYHSCVHLLKLQVDEANITQEDLAKALFVSQSQISRILSGKGRRRTPLFDEICIYVRNHIQGVSVETVKNNADLLEALASIWDGSSAQAQTIAYVIRSLGPFCKGNSIKSQHILAKQ